MYLWTVYTEIFKLIGLGNLGFVCVYVEIYHVAQNQAYICNTENMTFVCSGNFSVSWCVNV